MDLSIERRELPAGRLLAIELTTTPDSFDADLSVAFGRLGEVLTDAGAVFAGSGICAHPKRITRPGRVVVIAGIPFEGEVEPGEGMKIEELPAGPAIVGTLHGSYEHLPEAWAEMRVALANYGKARPKTSPYDCFVRSMVNVVNPDELITELVIPLA